jgi:hypothetical protein
VGFNLILKSETEKDRNTYNEKHKEFLVIHHRHNPSETTNNKKSLILTSVSGLWWPDFVSEKRRGNANYNGHLCKAFLHFLWK